MTATQSPDTARIARGRAIILAAIALTVVITVADLVVAIVAGIWKPEISAIRVLLIAILLWGLYRGRPWARLLFLVLVMIGMAFSGAILMEPPAASPVTAMTFAATVVVSGFVLVWFLAFDKSVVSYEIDRQARYPKLFGGPVDQA